MKRRVSRQDRKRFGWLAEVLRFKDMPEANKRVSRARKAIQGQSEFSAAKKPAVPTPPPGKDKPKP